jgi:hypothetical protein
MKKIYGIIYVATLLNTNRKYVGQTYSIILKEDKKLLDDRKRRHITTAKKNEVKSKKSHFHLALMKYGIESFGWEVIDRANNIEELNLLEGNYISKLNSASDKDGFNSRIEGENRIFTSNIKQKMKISAKKRWDSLQDTDKTRLVEKQQLGRDANPNLKKETSDRFKLMHKDFDFVKKMTANRTKAMQTNEFRIKRSGISKEYWSNKTDKFKQDHLAPMHSSPTRLENLRKSQSTNEYKKIISSTVKNRWKRKFVVTKFENGEKIAEFDNIIDAANFFFVHAPRISAVLRGVNKSFTPLHEGTYRNIKLFAKYV